MTDAPDDEPPGRFKFGLLQAIIVALAGVAIAVAAAMVNHGL